MALNEKDIQDLRVHADERLQKFGTNALIKVRGALIVAVLDALGSAQGTLDEAARPLDRDESGEVTIAREERDAASSRAANAERELELARAVVVGAEASRRKGLPEAVEAYRTEFPTATEAPATGDDGPGDTGGDGGE